MKTYPQALHAMQTGVQMEMQLKGEEGAACTPKLLRVGVNSAMVSNTALVGLLIRKGLITMNEVMESLTIEVNREVERYEGILKDCTGKDIKLH